MKILIVDDDEAITLVYSTALKAAGYEVISASTGATGIERARGEKPDLVLLDQVLTDIAGNARFLQKALFDSGIGSAGGS